MSIVTICLTDYTVYLSNYSKLCMPKLCRNNVLSECELGLRPWPWPRRPRCFFPALASMVLGSRHRPTTLARMIDCCIFRQLITKFAKVAMRIYFTLLSSSVALQPVLQHSWGISASSVVIKLSDTNVIVIVFAQSSWHAVTGGTSLSVQWHYVHLTDTVASFL